MTDEKGTGSPFDDLARKKTARHSGKLFDDLCGSFKEMAAAARPDLEALRQATTRGAMISAAIAMENGDPRDMLDALKFVAQISGLTKSDEDRGGALSDEQRRLLDAARREQTT